MPSSTNLFAKLGLAVVAPGGYAPDEAAFKRGIERLQALGCNVHSYYDTAARFQRFGATDAGRIAQLHAAAQNPDVQVVLALRGGYGLSRILPQLDFKMLAASGKLFVGHSDFTAFQMGLLAQAGAASFAGPMLCDDFTRDDLSDFTIEQFLACLSGPTHTVSGSAQDNPIIDVSGVLWGGNLAMLTHLVGTPYLPPVDGGILFIEDIHEHPYRVERMLLQLLNAGILGRQKALLLGDFSNYRLSDYDNGYDFGAMLDYLRAQLTVPVLTGLPFGHVRHKATLAVGSQAQLVSSSESFSLVMCAYPTLSA